MTYFSDREAGEVPRTTTEIPFTVWRGIAGLIRAHIEDGSFGAQFPEICLDGYGTCGTDGDGFWDALFAEIPNLAKGQNPLDQEQPAIIDLMDMIEFCWHAVGKPESWQFHSSFRHDHCNFDVEVGRAEFCDSVNRIFRRNGLVYELTDEGHIQRLAPVGFHEPLIETIFSTGDFDLDKMLETARRKFLDPDEDVRREALEKLWDAWERVKTVEGGQDKHIQTTMLLNRAAGSDESKFREILESEAKALTKIDNSFQIRHTETSQEPLQSSDHVDYLFQRLFSLIRLALRTTGRGG